MRVLRSILAALGVLGVADASSANEKQESSSQTPPNIVLILSDDQAWTDYGFMGHDAIQTPHLDRLAKESVVFGRGYVPTSLCRPSLMTIVTGHYAHAHRTPGNDPNTRRDKSAAELYQKHRAQLISHVEQLETLPRALSKLGYLSHQSGKWWEGGFARGGFTHGMTRGFPEPGGRHGDDGLTIGRHGLGPIEEFVDHAMGEEKPFFVWYAPFLPHEPHTPPKRLLDKYRGQAKSIHVAKYYAMCDWFDETCGQLLEMLEARGLRENTLVVYVTDNGWIQNPQRGRYAPRSKGSPYEGGVRTPILFSWPDKLQPEKRADIVSSIDLFPTILAAAGGKPSKDLPGTNLLPTMRENAPIGRDRIFGEGYAHEIANIEDPEASLLYRWCIEDKWKLILHYDGKRGSYAWSHPRNKTSTELYDLVSDPTEKADVASEHPAVVERMANRIGQWYPLKERQLISMAGDGPEPVSQEN